MSSGDPERVVDELLSGVAPSDELGERFQKQVESLLRPRLSKVQIVRNVFLTAVFIPMAGFFTYVAAVLSKGLPLFARVGFGGGALVFLAGAAFCISELRSGRVAPRKSQQGQLGIVLLALLLNMIGWLVFGSRLELPTDKAVWAGTGLLFFWMMFVMFWLQSRAQWHAEDALLEQKRTQLEIALLREQVSKSK